MVDPTRAICTVTAVLALALASSPVAYAQRDGEDKKPSLSLKANPPVGFSPLRVRLVVELKNGANDYQDYYCPGVQWDWGDGTVSENSEDCDPYQAGKSEIKRRYSVEHVFRQAQTYQVFFRLKQRERVIAAISANVEVRPGVRDDLGE